MGHSCWYWSAAADSDDAMRTDPTGRLDILIGGIIARIAQQNPVLHALYLAFEPNVQRAVKQLDSPAVRRVVRGMVNSNSGVEIRNSEPKSKSKSKRVRTGVVKAKVIPASDSANVIDAQWVTE